MPVAFWYFSLAGGVVLLTYAIYRRDPVFIIGQCTGLVIYIRNLWLIRAVPRRSLTAPTGLSRSGSSGSRWSRCGALALLPFDSADLLRRRRAILVLGPGARLGLLLQAAADRLDPAALDDDRVRRAVLDPAAAAADPRRARRGGRACRPAALRRPGRWRSRGFAFAAARGRAVACLLVSTDTPMLVCFALAHAGAFVRLGERPPAGWAVVLGGAIGVGLLSKYAMIYFPISAIAGGDRGSFGADRLARLAIAAAVALAIVAPNLLWNATNDFATLHHTADNAG